ncbi:MAG: hypothetical protein GC155_00080 [Alphaproteobacteria bacterium]|nr:hypothetical protein [Alphaproteobacteria bacterium]
MGAGSGACQQITDIWRERGDFGETWHTDVYGEYGLAKNWGGTLKLDTQIREDQNYDDRTSMEAGLQRSFAMSPRSVIAISASVLAGEALEGPECRGTGYETRAGYGRSASLGGHNAFVNVEAAFRSRGSDCERNLVEVAAGVDLTPKLHTILKAWSETGDKARSAKIETDLLYDIGKYSAGIGYRQEVSNAFDESGIVIAVWRRF